MTTDIEAIKTEALYVRAKYPEVMAHLKKQCWIRIMCDFVAAGVWDKEGCETSPDVLPISIELIVRIYAWQADYETLDPLDGPVDLDHFEAFDNEGFLIAIEMKRQLPDWTVIYHDAGRAEELNRISQARLTSVKEQYRAWFEYEITDEVMQSDQKPHDLFDPLNIRGRL